MLNDALEGRTAACRALELQGIPQSHQTPMQVLDSGSVLLGLGKQCVILTLHVSCAAVRPGWLRVLPYFAL